MLVAKLLVTCEVYFHVLFGYLNGSNNASSDEVHSIQSIEAANISQLYSLLMKIRDETLILEDLLESLVDLCSLKKDNIPCGLKFSADKQPLGSFGLFSSSFEASISSVYWASLFHQMSQIAIMDQEDQIRCEALSIMKIVAKKQCIHGEVQACWGYCVSKSFTTSKEGGWLYCAESSC